jgi:hypothetical protein
MMLGAGAGQAFLAIASAYAVIAFMFLLFPTGTLPSRRGRPVAAAGLVLAVLTTAGMADRLAAFGGALHVRSRPGEGTTLSGELPVSALG